MYDCRKFEKKTLNASDVIGKLKHQLPILGEQKDCCTHPTVTRYFYIWRRCYRILKHYWVYWLDKVVNTYRSGDVWRTPFKWPSTPSNHINHGLLSFVFLSATREKNGWVGRRSRRGTVNEPSCIYTKGAKKILICRVYSTNAEEEKYTIYIY